MKIRDLRFTTPGGWKYQEEKTGKWARGITFEQMVGSAAQHRINMKYPLVNPPFDTLAAEIEDWICRHLNEKDRGLHCEEKTRVVSGQPGYIFSSVIKKITGRHAVTCGRCMERMGQMNKWGWWGCWKNRGIILNWLIEEARGRGHQVSREHVSTLFLAALREVYRRRKETEALDQTPVA